MTGKISPAALEIRYVISGETSLIVNTRSSLALTRAGIPESQWVLKDVTNEINPLSGKSYLAEIESRLAANGLGSEGSEILRIGPRPENAQVVNMQGTPVNQANFSYLDE